MRPAQASDLGDQEVCVRKTSERSIALLGGKKQSDFTFDGILDSDCTQVLHFSASIRALRSSHPFFLQTAQEDVFTKVAKSVIDNCVQGFNGTILA